MKHNSIGIAFFSFFIMFCVVNNCASQRIITSPMKVGIITGTVRSTGTGEALAKNITAILDKRSDIITEIVDLKTYALPFYVNEIAPASRTEDITDPILKRWSDTIKKFDGYIIISPEYNSGYPASLKNALDSLYTEWNNKPVALVGYSGGTSGGTAMLAQLRQIVTAFKMIPIATDIKIPQSWKALHKDGKLVDALRIERELMLAIDQLIDIHNNDKK